jgi:hypothetical protein
LETYEFESFMQSRDAGHFLPYRDGPKGAAFKIAAREDAITNTETGAVHGDIVARTKAYLGGTVLRGTVANVQAIRVPRRTVYHFDVETRQRSLRLRERDELANLADARLRCEVRSVRRQGALTRVSLMITAGMRSVGCPTVGALLEFGPPPPDWDRLRRERIQMSARLTDLPWTHGEAAPPRASPHPMPRPGDLVADIESLS